MSVNNYIPEDGLYLAAIGIQICLSAFLDTISIVILVCDYVLELELVEWKD